MWFCLFVRRGYKDFQEAGNNRGLLHSRGIICTTEPQTIFFTLGQLKSNSSISLHPSLCSKVNFMSEQSSRICIVNGQDFMGAVMSFCFPFDKLDCYASTQRCVLTYY